MKNKKRIANFSKFIITRVHHHFKPYSFVNKIANEKENRNEGENEKMCTLKTMGNKVVNLVPTARPLYLSRMASA